MKRGCLIAPTTADIRDVMIEGPSGLLAATIASNAAAANGSTSRPTAIPKKTSWTRSRRNPQRPARRRHGRARVQASPRVAIPGMKIDHHDREPEAARTEHEPAKNKRPRTNDK